MQINSSFILPANIMAQETLAAPNIIRQQLEKNKPVIQDLIKHLQKNKPLAAMTIARGSSDHGATFAKYLIETQMGIITSSSAPSVNSIYKSNLQLKNILVIGISQSGQSPDICQVMEHSKKQGAITVALVNEVSSPLAEVAQFVIPLHAGAEKAVAATKSFMATLSALLHIVASYTNNNILLNALEQVPQQLEQTAQLYNTSSNSNNPNKAATPWHQAIPSLIEANNMFVLARGTSFPIAQEVALKFKETCCIQAEPFSSAEVLHGPFALVKPNFNTLMFAQKDQTLLTNLDLIKKISQLSANTLLAAPINCFPNITGSNQLQPEDIAHIQKLSGASVYLPLPNSINPLTDPLMMIYAFYQMVNCLAVMRGFNPDQPENLKKVTQTN